MAHGYPDFEGQKSSLYLVPQWEAFRSEDKDLVGAANVAATWEDTVLTYTVPSGKVLYIVSWGCYIRVLNTAVIGRLRKTAGAVITNHGLSGGMGGFSVQCPKPVVFAAGEVLSVLAWNLTAAAASVWAYATGYEI